MQIKNQDEKQGLIEVIPESIDDLWHLSHIVQEDDYVSEKKKKENLFNSKRESYKYLSDSLVLSYPLTDYGWLILSEVETSNMTRTTDYAQKISLAISCIGLLSMGFITLFMINKVVFNIRIVSNGLDEISKGRGDLTQRLAIIGNDEVTEVSVRFNKFIGYIQRLLLQIQDVTNRLTEMTNTISSLTNQSNDSIQNIFGNTQRITKGSRDSASTLETTAASIEEISANSQLIAKRSNRAYEESVQNRLKATQGMETVREASTTIKEIEHAVGDSSRVLEELKNQSR